VEKGETKEEIRIRVKERETREIGRTGRKI
jgi:hypothetical protein